MIRSGAPGAGCFIPNTSDAPGKYRTRNWTRHKIHKVNGGAKQAAANWKLPSNWKLPDRLVLSQGGFPRWVLLPKHPPIPGWDQSGHSICTSRENRLAPAGHSPALAASCSLTE